MYSGIINIYKEKGYTSHDVVAKLRGILKQKKIGHTGTLDPDAVGVLPICLGKGTKLCDMITDTDKIYETVLLLGKVTDTQDCTGEVLEEKKVDVNKEQITTVIQKYIGDYSQIPPMYSAIKINGKKLYELAREGQVIERKPRQVKIYNIEIMDINLKTNEIRMKVECSKGTYIRTLCHDIGNDLDCGGCMKELTRTKVGRFHISDSLTLSDIEKECQLQNISSHIISVEEMFKEYSKIIISDEHTKLIYNGNTFSNTHITTKTNKVDNTKKVRVYDNNDVFIGIYEYIDEEKLYKPVKMFLP